MISIIVAVADDWGIGRDNELLWHIPEDLKRFKKLTTGNAVIMGKKTWDSLPKKPLPGRKNIVLTDNQKDSFEGAMVALSIDEALKYCENGEEVFIIGGGSVYRQFMTIADRLYIKHVHKTAPADIYFPEIDPQKWEVTESENGTAEIDGGITYTYTIYNRRKPL
jgi:dihydrofolate reductase